MSKKIKIRDIEGDAEEIKNLFKDMDCDLGVYLNAQPSKKNIHFRWIWLLVILFLMVNLSLWLNWLPEQSNLLRFLSLAIFAIVIVGVHYNFNTTSLTIVVSLVGICLILVSFSVYTPEEVSKKVQEELVKNIK